MKETTNNKRISTWKRQFRICRDNYLGYEVQTRTLLWPFWRLHGFCNTFISAEAAERYAENAARSTVKNL